MQTEFFGLASIFRKTDKAKQKILERQREIERKRPSPGVLQGNLGPGLETRFAVSGQDILVDDDSWIFGELKAGSEVRVTTAKRGVWTYARKIVVLS